MAEKRKRGQNFSLEEKDKLIKILFDFKDTILNKKTDGATNEAKNKAWASVTDTFNSTSMINRNKESLMKVWEKLKFESKTYYNNTKRNLIKTNGGPSIIKIDPVLEQVCAILGRGSTDIIGVSDCDVEVEDSGRALPKAVFIEDVIQPQELLEITMSLAPDFSDNIKTPSEETKDISHCSPNDTVDQNKQTTTETEVNKTLLQSQRKPQLHQKTERTEAVSSLCASFQEVNKKKENIEELRLELLRKEINFKTELYELQLETARQELEIKREVLKQLKGGGISLQNLLGVSIEKNNKLN